MRILRRHARQIETEELEADAAAEEAEVEDVEESGPQLLSDGPLLARWYIIYELEKEMKRASRHERPLSVMVLEPTPTLGSSPSEEALLQAAEAARRASRATDLIGWLPNGGILVVMPETDKDGAAAAVYRWRNEMYTSTLRHGAIRWRVATNVNASSFETPQALLEAVGGELQPAEEAA